MLRTFVAVGAVALLFAACGGTNRATAVDPTQQVAGTPTSNATASDTSLSDALLVLSDMPTGWTVSSPSTSGTSSGNEICNTSTSAKLDKGGESASFQKSSTGPLLLEAVNRYDGNLAHDIIAGTRAAANSCTDWIETDADGTTTKYHISALSFPSYGDETFALRLSTDPTIIGVDADIIIVRHGNVLLYLAHVAIGFSGVDSDQTDAFAKQADAKLKSALGLH